MKLTAIGGVALGVLLGSVLFLSTVLVVKAVGAVATLVAFVLMGTALAALLAATKEDKCSNCN